MDEKIEIIETDIAEIKLNFDEIEKWRQDSENAFPVYSFISFYNACGLTDIVKEYSNNNDHFQPVPIDNFLCNFYTLQRIKKFIENTWKTYALDINGDNSVYWKPTSKFGREKHYPQNLSKKIKACLGADLACYSCGIDDELEDNVIVFRIYDKVSSIIEGSGEVIDGEQ